MVTSSTERKEAVVERETVPTPDESWQRHTEVLALVEQIRRTRARQTTGDALGADAKITLR